VLTDVAPRVCPLTAFSVWLLACFPQDYFVDGVNSVLAKGFGPEDAAAGLASVLTNATLAQELGSTAAAFVRRQYVLDVAGLCTVRVRVWMFVWESPCGRLE
jgi:hypothetical protein